MAAAGARVVYEVNLDLDASIADDYRAWLEAHIREILGLPGFVGARLAQVDDRPHGLHHRAGNQIGGYGGQGRDLKEEHQNGGHQCPAAHAGESDDDADSERGDGE